MIADTGLNSLNYTVCNFRRTRPGMVRISFNVNASQQQAVHELPKYSSTIICLVVPLLLFGIGF